MLVPVAAVASDEACYPFATTPLVVAYAAVERTEAIRPGAHVALALAPDLSPHDAYLVLPARAYDALESTFALGQTGRLAQWFDEAVVVEGDIERTRRGVRLVVSSVWAVRDVLATAAPQLVALRGVGDPIRVANQLEAVASLAPCGLFDREAGEVISTGREHAGLSRADLLEHTADADGRPTTCVWAVPDDAGTTVTVRVALATEDGTTHALLAPVAFAI